MYWNRSLDALERSGCVRSTTVPSPRGPARRVYRLTRRGRQRLTDWIRQAPKIPRVKFEYAAQLFSVTHDLEPAARAREILLAIRKEALPSLMTLRAIDRYMRGVPGYPDALPGELFYPWLTLRHGLLRREALLTWVDECLEHVDRRPEDAYDAIAPDALTVLSEMLQSVAGQIETPAGAHNKGEHDD